MLHAVVFDFDGIVLDSETPEFESHRQIFGRCGVSLTREEWCHQIGIYSDGYEQRWFRRLCEVSPEPVTMEQFAAEKRRLFDTLVSSEPMRGVRRLLEELRAASVPTAIASASSGRWVVSAAQRIGVADLFQTIVTSDDVPRRKPAPDVYLEAVRRLGANPACAVAVEDSGPGIAAARAAGLKTVAIPHWLTERHDLSAADLRVAHAGELTLEVLRKIVG